MRELAVHEAKTRLSELLVEVEQGAQFVITQRGVAVAKLVPAAPAAAQRSKAGAQRERVRDAFEGLQRLREGVPLGSPLRQVIDAGRD